MNTDAMLGLADTMAGVGSARVVGWGADGGARMLGYDQGCWAHACGTPSCIAGWAVARHYAERQGGKGIGEVDLHEVYERETGEKARWDGDDPAGIEAEVRMNEFQGWLMRRAAGLLELGPEEAEILFDQHPMAIGEGEWTGGNGPTVEDAVATLRQSAARGRIAWTHARG